MIQPFRCRFLQGRGFLRGEVEQVWGLREALNLTPLPPMPARSTLPSLEHEQGSGVAGKSKQWL